MTRETNESVADAAAEDAASESAPGRDTASENTEGEDTAAEDAASEKATADATPESRDGSEPAERFLLDVMLGKLATYLRMCGHDAAYALDRDVEADDRLRRLAAAEGRRLVTRDDELADRTPGAVRLTERGVEGQLRELHATGVDLTLAARPARCGRCNGAVEQPPESADRPPYAPDDLPVWRCLDCDQWFWKGSHWDRVADVLASARDGDTSASRDGGASPSRDDDALASGQDSDAE